MNTLDIVRNAIVEMNQQYPRYGFELSLISNPFDINGNFSQQYPNTGSPGVYILLNECYEVLRIGKASCQRTQGHRPGLFNA